MDRAGLLARVARTERHVAEGYFRVERQRLLVERLARGGYSEMAQMAADILAGFEIVLAAHVADHERAVKELAENSN